MTETIANSVNTNQRFSLIPWIVGFLAISGVGGSIFFFTHEPNNQGFVDFPTITLLHVIPGAFYLALAPFQFSKNIRARSIEYHRWAGRLLVGIALVIGAAAMFLGLIVPFSGIPEQLVIGFFGTVFLFSIVKGFLCVRAKQIAQHREWMMRAFTIGLSIATMRLIFIPLLIINGNPSDEDAARLSIISFSIAFALHSGFTEYWIRRTRVSSASNTSSAESSS